MMFKMNALIVTSILAIISSLEATDDENPLQTAQPATSTVEVDVYYEALCPDSQKFFNYQLHPNLGLINENNVKLNLIPFGKATHEFDVTTQKEVFKCRHTATECEGHKIQACALSTIQEPSVAYEYISCLMKKGAKDQPYPGQECANAYENINYSEIEQCANSDEAITKVTANRILTESLRPPLESVPVIVFNKVYKKEDQELAEKNFKGALCRYLKVSTPDTHACLTASAQGHTLTLSLLISALVGIFVACF